MTFVVILSAAGVSHAVINTWFCNSATCSEGSCQTSSNITEGECVNAPSGVYGTFIKPICVGNPSPTHTCAIVNVYGTASQLVNNADNCRNSVSVRQTVPCDLCLPFGPNDKPYKLSGCSFNTLNMSYGCNADCSSCDDHVTVTGQQCQDVGGWMVSTYSNTVCPKLIAYTTYNVSTCNNNAVAPVQYFAPDLNCNGYTGRSNARANVFTCA